MMYTLMCDTRVKPWHPEFRVFAVKGDESEAVELFRKLFRIDPRHVTDGRSDYMIMAGWPKENLCKYYGEEILFVDG